MSPPSGTHLLHQLAHLYGIQTTYYDVTHRRQQPPVDALLAVLRALGAAVESLDDVPSAWRERRQALWQRPLEPVVVNWDGEALMTEVRLPSDRSDALLAGHLVLETGERQRWEWCGADLPVLKTVEIEGIQYDVKRLLLSEGLPWGYHRLTLEAAGALTEALIIVAPRKAYSTPDELGNRTWGVFLPLYALYTQNSWGSGNLSDLETLIEWVAGIGGRAVATLPLLATFIDESSGPSPYLPMSRLLWNEFYLDITKVPELRKCPSAQALTASLPLQKEIEAMRNSPLVNYHRQMALKRQVLEELCRCCFTDASDRLESLVRFAKAHPVVENYACFRATCEKQRIPWQSWPQLLREGMLKEGDYDEGTKRYHLYVQWLTHQQIQALSQTASKKGLRLYLDLPLGVHPNGYDVWRERTLFTLGISTGAPPDAVFTKGQNWEFPPLHPDKIREQGYRYPIAYLRHHLRYAGILRIDHVMGLLRLYWIPKGLDASQGVYVRYRAEELYAILALESHRYSSIIVGEDLGTVPPEVRPAMIRHNIHRMYVVHYELALNPQAPPRHPPHNCVASLNTHDMPPFAAFWQDLDIKERVELGLLDKAGAQMEHKTRRAMREAMVSFLQDKGCINKPSVDTQTILRGCLAFLSASTAQVVLVNLEDLWLETQPQNVPGTQGQRTNWQRKARYSLEAFCQMPPVLDTLKELNYLRKRGRCPR